jgi:maltoporin
VEKKMKQISLLVLSVCISLWSVENSVGTTGYARIQTSLDNEKANVCFKAPGAGSKYRLGNECETWIELGLYDTLRFDNGVILHNQIRPVFTGPNNHNIEYLQLDEAYSELSAIFDNSVSFWIGRRFYERYDSHMNDYFFLNMSGDGVGFRNLDLGAVRLSYSYIFDRLDPSSVVDDEKVLLDSHDLRLTIPIERGAWTLFLNQMTLHSKEFNATQSIPKMDGYALGVLYKDTKITRELFGMEGENISALFYGKGVAKGAGSVSPYRQERFVDAVLASGRGIEEAKTWRFINYNSFENDQWGMISNVVYEKRRENDFSSTEQTWVSVGIRPYWFFHRNGRFLLEEGIDRVKDEMGDQTYTVIKSTVALEAALEKGVWKRPVVRLYYTHADWSENARGSVGGEYYADQRHGDNVGVQFEYWW